MTMRLVVLTENRAREENIVPEHGLALWVEYRGRQILFDTGQTDVLLANARALGIDLTQLDDIILSHGHYDHTGGLAGVLGMAGKAKVWMHPKAVKPRYAVRPPSAPRDISMPASSLAVLRERRMDISFTESVQPLAKGMTIVSAPPLYHDFETLLPEYSLDQMGKMIDPFEDELSLVFECEEGVVLLLGCSHRGVVNILRQVGSLFPGTPLLAIVGGMHLAHASDERIRETLHAFKLQEVRQWYPGHCTGSAIEEKMAYVFPTCLPLYAGMSILI